MAGMFSLYARKSEGAARPPNGKKQEVVSYNEGYGRAWGEP